MLIVNGSFGDVLEQDLYDLGFVRIKNIDNLPASCENFAFQLRDLVLFVWKDIGYLHIRWDTGTTTIDNLVHLKVLLVALKI